MWDEDGLGQVSRRISNLTGAAITETPPPTNVSIPRAVRISQTSLDLIAEYYADDFARFGYAVEVPPLRGITKV